MYISAFSHLLEPNVKCLYCIIHTLSNFDLQVTVSQTSSAQFFRYFSLLSVQFLSGPSIIFKIQTVFIARTQLHPRYKRHSLTTQLYQQTTLFSHSIYFPIFILCFATLLYMKTNQQSSYGTLSHLLSNILRAALSWQPLGFVQKFIPGEGVNVEVSGLPYTSTFPSSLRPEEKCDGEQTFHGKFFSIENKFQ